MSISLSLSQGLMAIHSPNTGIVDYAEVTKSYADDFKQAGGKVFTSSKVNYVVKLPSKGSEIAIIIATVVHVDAAGGVYTFFYFCPSITGGWI